MKGTLLLIISALWGTGFLFFMDHGESGLELSSRSSKALYEDLELKKGVKSPPYDLFRKGYQGFRKAIKNGELSKKLLTLIDFRLSANKERLWVIDLDSGMVRMQTLVAHGKGTGNEYAREFSNTPGSNKSSLGFYATAEIYRGKHGLSLKLDGLEEGFNDNVRDRAIVMHGADYVSNSFAERYGRIGRSYGCPSVPLGVHKELIPFIKGGSCLFIYYPKEAYLKGSAYLPDGTS